MMPPLRPPRRRDRTEHDAAGWTLVELLVSMGMFTTFLAIFMVAVVSWIHTTTRTTADADQAAEGRKVFDSFDKSVLPASAVNPPTQNGNDWFIEVQDTSSSGSVCRQWVYRGDTGVIASRQWTSGTTTTAPAWVTLGTRFTHNPAAAPFTTNPVSTTSLNPSVTLNLFATTPAQNTTGTFVARNATKNTTTKVCLSDFVGAQS